MKLHPLERETISRLDRMSGGAINFSPFLASTPESDEEDDNEEDTGLEYCKPRGSASIPTIR